MATLNDLPLEIITIILKNNDCSDILNFAATCKKFDVMVKNDRYLWKNKFKSILPSYLHHDVEENIQGDWFAEMKNFCSVKQIICDELFSMSSLCYWHINSDLLIQDVRNIFDVALSNNFSYSYTIYFLRKIIIDTKNYNNELKCKNPYTLTNAYYAKAAVRHLMHTYLAVKLIKTTEEKELVPENVLNLFVQWVDTDNFHLDADIDKKITKVVEEVEIELGGGTPANCSSIAEKLAQGLISEREVLEVITFVLYHVRHMTITSSFNLDVVDIVQVLDNKRGNEIALAVIYQAVARRCGVKCELIRFSSGLSLQWRDNSPLKIPQVYAVDLATGELLANERWPFFLNQNIHNIDALMSEIFRSFYIKAIFNGYDQDLLDFFCEYRRHENNPYRKFLNFLIDHKHVPAMNTPLNLNYLSDAQLQIMSHLPKINTPNETENRYLSVKTRNSSVKFTVGTICDLRDYRNLRRYPSICIRQECVVYGWDVTCAVEHRERVEKEPLEFGSKQPFYHVVAADKSKQYVAQETLDLVARPNRMFPLEDVIARYFTHFDGFSYVPNDQMRMEYPEDAFLINLFHDDFKLKASAGGAIGFGGS